jgi:hypothetical protein
MNKLFFVALLCITSITQCTQKSQTKSAVITGKVMIDPFPTSQEYYNLVLRDRPLDVRILMMGGQREIVQELMVEVKIVDLNAEAVENTHSKSSIDRVAGIDMLRYHDLRGKKNGDKIYADLRNSDGTTTSVELTCCANPKLDEPFEASLAECEKGYQRSQRICNHMLRIYENMPEDTKQKVALWAGFVITSGLVCLGFLGNYSNGYYN